MAVLDSDLDPSTDAVLFARAARESVRTETARRELRFRRGIVIGICMSILLSLLVAGGLGLYLARQTEDVAQRTSAIVGERVVADARAARVSIGRAELAKANTRLARRQLPIVPDPGQYASGDALLIQAARASVLADLPEVTVGALRRELGGRGVLPSALTDTTVPLGDAVADLLPASPDTETGSPGRGPATETRPRSGTGQGGGAPAAPAPGRSSTARPAPPRPVTPTQPPGTAPPQRSPLVRLPLLPLCVPGLLNTC